MSCFFFDYACLSNFSHSFLLQFYLAGGLKIRPCVRGTNKIGIYVLEWTIMCVVVVFLFVIGDYLRGRTLSATDALTDLLKHKRALLAVDQMLTFDRQCFVLFEFKQQPCPSVSIV